MSKSINSDISFLTGDKVKQRKTPRICQEKGCNTPLSGYNYGSYCFRHRRMRALDGKVYNHHKMRGDDY